MLQSFAISNAFGTCIAFSNSVNSELNTKDASSSLMMATIGGIILDGADVLAMRHRLHELANVFTGVTIAGGLLAHQLETGRLEAGQLRHYASNICEGSERGCVLVREIRSQLLSASGGIEALPHGSSGDSTLGL